MALGKKTGGRRPGSLNKTNQSLLDKAKAYGCDPFDVLLKFAAGDWEGLGYDNECYQAEKPDGSIKLGYTITPDMRLRASSEASKYLYPQRKAIELSGNITTEMAEAAEEVKKMSKEDKIKLLEEELRNLKK